MIKKYEVTVEDEKTVTVKDLETGNKGVAKCCPQDKFDLGIGINLAIERLTDVKIKTEDDMKKYFKQGRLTEFVVNDECKTTAYSAYVYRNQKLKLINVGDSLIWGETNNGERCFDFKHIDLVKTSNLIITRQFKDIPNGSKIKILKTNSYIHNLKKGDVGIKYNQHEISINGELFYINVQTLEDEYFEFVEYLIPKLEDVEFKKCKVVNLGWEYDIYDQFADMYNLNYKKYESPEQDIVYNVVGKAKHICHTNMFVYVIEKEGQHFMVDIKAIEKYEPKLYDSFGTELKEGDKFILLDIDNRNYSDKSSIVKSESNGELFSHGVMSSHNSSHNNGKPTNGWKVIKVNKL